MRSKILLGAAVLALIVTIGWAISRSMSTRLGANGNNGYSQEFQPPSPKMQKTMEQMRKRMEETRAALSPEENRQLMQMFRQRFMNGGPGGGRPGAAPPPAP